jgi:hypothetical protein
MQTADDPLKVAVQHLKDETYNPTDDVLKVRRWLTHAVTEVTPLQHTNTLRVKHPAGCVTPPSCAQATTMELVSTLKELLHLHPLYNEQLKSFAAFGGATRPICQLHERWAMPAPVR